MDRRIITFIAISICYLFYVSPANALTFTANVTPSEVNASDKDMLVNFTIDHTNTTANITQVNVTLPSGFLYSGATSDDATASGNATSIDEDTTGGIIKWTNSTKSGFVTGTNRFWFEIDAPGSNATFKFNVSVRDTADIITSVNVTFKLLDTIAPKFSSNTTSVATTSKYVRNRTYEFSAIWTDGVSVNTTLIEHNFTGTSANYTMFRSGSTYKYNFTDIAAGLYIWRMFVNDTVNNVNGTDQYFYNVSLAENILEISFDGNRNTDYQTSNESALNVTANSSAGTISIYRNNNLIKSGSTPQTSLDTLAAGAYTYKANVTGNQNYTDNSTGISYIATLTGHAPKWSSNTTSFASKYSNTTVSTFEVAWKDNIDSNGFNTAIIELNHSGGFVNYTMYRVPGTNRSQFNSTIPAGIIRWKAYANNSNNVFNATPLWASELAQTAPAITIASSLGFEADVGGETNITCSADTVQVTLKLFRDGTEVSIPYKASLAIGKYVFKCNNTATQNYSSSGETKTLEMKAFTKYLSIVNISSALKVIELAENSSTSIAVEVKNSGNLSDTVSFSIETINTSWYIVNASAATLAARGGTSGFLVNFSVGFVEIKDYSGRFKIVGAEETLYSDFILRIVPGIKTKMKINDTLILYKAEFLKLGLELNESKSQNKSVSDAEAKYESLKVKLAEAENNIAQGNYANIAQIFDEIKSLIESTKANLSKVQTPIEQIQQIVEGSNFLTYVIIIAAIIVVGVLAYLFWPTSTKYEVKAPKSTEPSMVAKLKKKLNEMTKKEKKFKYDYKGE
ncbi:MAG: hypothetical protein HY361_03250 [Candidatus Aenigmarchaeota archaeon]|nr:hypothetical protein [Candidatus Aenigmarchaeota archaeon]